MAHDALARTVVVCVTRDGEGRALNALDPQDSTAFAQRIDEA
eukprot:CAMPEP_0181292452 /NCGR_PEP_ID=MMETSP1101-20121128/2514_1 /TAXON_ID=46948 /ORGANISM="Rhodomonas abbreviata, Strain Caron Lab Isolate" /LENGTH=41 /DNA_ID= /DNA_START= /DNA_END= /DNA_ORIENTATION=